MNRCLSFNEGTATRDDNNYVVNESGVNSESTKWEGPGEKTAEYGER
jgi:hypothetical protein